MNPMTNTRSINKKSLNTKIRVQDYDSNLEYDYRKYWKDREYENQSERNILSKLLKDNNLFKSKPNNSRSFIDIGGGYGRLTDLYQNKYSYSILFDYSFSNLKKAEGKNNLDSNVFKVCGDIYNMPFKDGSISSGMLVRVLHHIENPDLAISEISRVISNSFILEFANKDHMLSRMRHFKDKDFRKQDIYSIPHKNDSQGFLNDQIFLNFSPSYIIKTLVKNHLIVKKVFSASNFRQKYFKKLFNTNILISLDNKFGIIFSKTYFGPSIFLYLLKDDNLKNNFLDKAKDIKDIFKDSLCCPICHGDLKNLYSKKLVCQKCGKSYDIKDGIYIFK